MHSNIQNCEENKRKIKKIIMYCTVYMETCSFLTSTIKLRQGLATMYKLWLMVKVCVGFPLLQRFNWKFP